MALIKSNIGIPLTLWMIELMKKHDIVQCVCAYAN